MWQRLTRRYAQSLLANAQFRRLWLNAFVTELGAKFSVVAIPLLAISELHAGPFQTGVMVACHAAAFALASLLAGVLADRFSPKKMLMAGQAAMALSLLTVPIGHALGWLRIEWLYVLEALIGVAVAMIVASGHIYAARLAGPERVVEANSLFFGCDSLASLLGPGIAGWMVGWLSPAWAISIDSVCIALAITLLWGNADRLRTRHAHERVASLFADFIEGWHAVLRDRLLRLLSMASAMFQILYHGHVALQILLATKVLGLTPAAFGMAMMLGGAGALLAALATADAVKRWGEKRLFLLSLAALSVCWIALALLPRNGYTLLLFAPAIFAFDLVITAFGILYVSARQHAAPPALLGRVTATSRFLAFVAAPLGGIAFGWMAEHVGVRWAYSTMGGLGVGLALLLLVMLRDMRFGTHARPAHDGPAVAAS